MSNKNLPLPYCYADSSINYIINITENIPNGYLCARVLEFKIQSQSNLKRYKQFVTALTSTLVFLSTLPWCYDAEMSTANSLHALA